jgi:putative membrane protein
MPGWDYNDWGIHGAGWFGALFMFITMIVFWGGLITVAVLLLRRLGPRGTHQDTAGRILDERFARGEIDEDEYHRRQQALRSTP